MPRTFLAVGTKVISHVECPRLTPPCLCMRGSISSSAFRITLKRVDISHRTSSEAWIMNSSLSNAFASTTYFPSVSKSYDVLGLGEAMIDCSLYISDEALSKLQIEKGGRRIVCHDDQPTIEALKATSTVSAGSSMANTLVAISHLSYADGNRLRVGFAGCLGSDREGAFFSVELVRNGVDIIGCASDESKSRLTGCVTVLITPDAQRSFLVQPGEGTLVLSESLKAGITKSRILLIEGYLFGLPEAIDRIKEAVEIAKRNGTIIALTAGAADVVRESRKVFWEVIKMGVDIFLCNRSEAVALLEIDAPGCAYEAVKSLSQYFSLVAVTDGSRGSYIATPEKLQTIPPFWRKEAPIDTTGAGDVYAAGLILGYLRQYDLHRMGLTASRSASSVIAKQGSQLTKEEALEIMTDVSYGNDKLTVTLSS